MEIVPLVGMLWSMPAGPVSFSFLSEVIRSKGQTRKACTSEQSHIPAGGRRRWQRWKAKKTNEGDTPARFFPTRKNFSVKREGSDRGHKETFADKLESQQARQQTLRHCTSNLPHMSGQSRDRKEKRG